jgi:hypothetical protein
MSTSPKLPTHLPGLARGPRNIKQITAVPIPGKNEHDRIYYTVCTVCFLPPTALTFPFLFVLIIRVATVAYIYVQ